jgi:hypothetical protein
MAHIRARRADLVAALDREQQSVAQLRDAIKAGPYPLGTGDTELARVFAWRFWALIGNSGRIGVVLPRAATLSAPGMATWRHAILNEGGFADVCALLNNRGWVFADVHPQYSVALVTILRSTHPSEEVVLDGPYRSMDDYLVGRNEVVPSVSVREFREWSEGAAFPLLPGKHSIAIFRRLARHPRFGTHPKFDFRPIFEVHSSNDKHFFTFGLERPTGAWPIYSGSSINLWTPETGEVYAWADANEVTRHLQSKARSQARHATSGFSGLSARTSSTTRRRFRAVTLAVALPRCDESRPTRRTVHRMRLLHGECRSTAQWRPTCCRREATRSLTKRISARRAVSSRPLDWWARRHVETTLSFADLQRISLYRMSLRSHPGFDLVVGATRDVLLRWTSASRSWASEVGVSRSVLGV